MVMALGSFMLRRLLGNGVLAFSIALGFVLTVTLVTAIPLYSEGISEFVLRQDLRATGSRLASGVVVRHADVRTADQPPTSRQEYLEADAFFSRLGDFVGLPERNRVHYLQSDRFALMDLDHPTELPLRDADVVYGFLAAMTGIEANVIMLEGRAPSPEVGTLRDISGQDLPLVEAMLTSQSLDDAGLLVGDRVKALHTDPYTYEHTLLAIDIVGRFVPADPGSTFWFQNLDALSRGPVFIHPGVFRDSLLVRYPKLFRRATWYSDFEPDAIRTDNYVAVGAALGRLRASAGTILPDTRVASRLASILATFGQRLFFLKLLLFVLAAPILAIVLYFMRLSAGMAVERQRGEIAILKSRGAGTRQIVGVYVLEGLLIGGFAMLLGPLLGLGLAQAIGKTHSFLVFTDREALPMRLNLTHYALAAGAVAISIAITVAPAIAAARRSIVGFKQDVSRTLRRPLYQRMFLDLLLLATAFYGYFALRVRESLPALGPEGAFFSDVLLVIVPVAFIFAASLTMLRLVPPAIRLFAWVGSRFYGVSGYVGLRQLARRPGYHIWLVLLLVLTFGLGTFSASMAATIDRNITDRVYFGVGADALLVEGGDYDSDAAVWYIPPVERHLDARSEDGEPGLEQVARFWSDDGKLTLAGRGTSLETRVYGVDAHSFGQTVRWRDDFAPASLNALMNALTRDERALLLDRRLLAATPGLGIGDPVRLEVDRVKLEFVVAGWIDSLPTHYPDDGTFVVANLRYLETWLGESPWDVLARLRPGVTAGELSSRLRPLGITVLSTQDARKTVLQAQQDPTQIGTFGILTMGFLISAVLTLVGFLVYSIVSFRRRLPEFGMLRAIGLSHGQMLALLSFENGILVVLGSLAGTALGVLTGTLFIPFLQLSADRQADTPPFIVVTAWDDIGKIYIVFGAVLLLALPVSFMLLRRIRTHEAMKFGEDSA